MPHKRSAAALRRREERYRKRVETVIVREIVKRNKDGSRSRKNGGEVIEIRWVRRNGTIGNAEYVRQKNGYYVRTTVHKEPIMKRIEYSVNVNRYIRGNIMRNCNQPHPGGKSVKYISNYFTGEYKETEQKFRYLDRNQVLKVAERLSRGRGYRLVSADK